MIPSTEAACLLQSGRMYPRRVGLRDGSGEDVFLGIKSGGFSVYFGDAPIYHFDFEGRWQRAFVAGVHYLKGLDATVRAIQRDREGGSLVLRRRALSGAEASELDEAIRSAALDLIDAFDAGRLAVIPPPTTAREIHPREIQGYLGRVADWDAAAWLAHRDRYNAVYGPWPFLPPDCPSPVVLQATLGHATGRAFGRDRQAAHHVRSPREFEEHLRAVAGLLGRRVLQCRDVFLAGGDVLRQPVGQVLGYLGSIDSHFSTLLDPPRSGGSGQSERGRSRVGVVHAFLDDFRPPLPDREGWRRLKAARLGRVTLGIESGDEAIRVRSGKTWVDDALQATVTDLKAVGIGVGVAVLVGVGGRAMAEVHLEATGRLVGSLGLGQGDLVCLVDTQSLGGAAGEADPLSDDESAGQIAAFHRRLAVPRPSKGPRLVAYNPEKQWA